MEGKIPERDEIFALLAEWTKGESLIRHCLSVEAAMKAYAVKFGADEKLWAAVGLIHDFDYESHPSLEEHPMVGCEELRSRGWPEEAVRAILSHSDESGVSRDSLMEKTLYAVDELTGFITAVALVRPSRSLDDLKAKSVRKKMKDKQFAAAIDRQQLKDSAQALGVEFGEHVDFVIAAMRTVQDQLGFNRLEGN